MIYNNILAALFGNNWYASAEYMGAVLQFAENIFVGKRAFQDLDSIHEYIEQETHIQGAHQLGRVGTRGTEVQLLDNGTAVVPITGIIAPRVSAIRMSMSGTSMKMLEQRAKELQANGDVSRVVLHINSGGGSVLGVPEAARAIRELAKVKPVTAYFDHIGASAAYFLASAAGRRVVTDSSIVGSIGVYTIVATQARKLEKDGIDARIIRRGAFKAVPNGIEPLEAQEAGLELVKADVDLHYNVFVNAIKDNLGISMTDAEKLADGAVHTGKAAVEAGLADEKGTLEQVLAGDIQADVVKTDESIETVEASLDFKDGAPTEERAEEISASLPEASVEETLADVEADIEAGEVKVSEVDALKLKLALAEAQIEANKEQAKVEAADAEKTKILAAVETAVDEGRIAPMKAEAITELAIKVGLETFTELLAAIPKAPVLEDMSVAPEGSRSDNPYVAADKIDENAPTTQAEVELFRGIPALKKRYGL